MIQSQLGCMVERWYSKKQNCQAKEGLFQRVPQQTAKWELNQPKLCATASSYVYISLGY